jgi:hypothetical protein
MMRAFWISAGVIASVGTVLGLSLLLGTGVRGQAPRTEREAVMAVLDRRGIRYTDVQVQAAAPGGEGHFAMVAAVMIMADPSTSGRIECLSRDECALWIDALGVRHVPLPALARTPS